MTSYTFGEHGSGATYEGSTSRDLQLAIEDLEPGSQLILLPGVYEFGRRIVLTEEVEIGLE